MLGDHVFLVDDLATTGLILKIAASAIRAEEGLISDTFVLLDMEEDGREGLTKCGMKLHCMLKMSKASRRL